MFYFLRKVLCSQYAFLKSTFKLFFWHLKWFAALHCKNIRLEIHSRVVRHPWSLHSLVMWWQHFLIMAYWKQKKWRKYASRKGIHWTKKMQAVACRDWVDCSNPLSIITCQKHLNALKIVWVCSVYQVNTVNGLFMYVLLLYM